MRQGCTIPCRCPYVLSTILCRRKRRRYLAEYQTCYHKRNITATEANSRTHATNKFLTLTPARPAFSEPGSAKSATYSCPN